jgi:hypothetical protein
MSSVGVGAAGPFPSYGSLSPAQQLASQLPTAWSQQQMYGGGGVSGLGQVGGVQSATQMPQVPSQYSASPAWQLQHPIHINYPLYTPATSVGSVPEQQTSALNNPMLTVPEQAAVQRLAQSITHTKQHHEMQPPQPVYFYPPQPVQQVQPQPRFEQPQPVQAKQHAQPQPVQQPQPQPQQQAKQPPVVRAPPRQPQAQKHQQQQPVQVQPQQQKQQPQPQPPQVIGEEHLPSVAVQPVVESKSAAHLQGPVSQPAKSRYQPPVVVPTKGMPRLVNQQKKKQQMHGEQLDNAGTEEQQQQHVEQHVEQHQPEEGEQQALQQQRVVGAVGSEQQHQAQQPAQEAEEAQQQQQRQQHVGVGEQQTQAQAPQAPHPN